MIIAKLLIFDDLIDLYISIESEHQIKIKDLGSSLNKFEALCRLNSSCLFYKKLSLFKNNSGVLNLTKCCPQLISSKKYKKFQ